MSDDLLREHRQWMKDTRINLMLLLFIVVSTVGLLSYSMMFPPPEKDISGITKEQAVNEACILEKNMKYPESSDNSINRLCYLEEVGRKLAE